MKRETEPVIKGEFTHPRTRHMLEIALAHAKAAFAGSCGASAPSACVMYGGSVWNQGTHLTVIIDRCVCALHAPRVPFAAVEVWIYDVSGDSPRYLGKDDRPETAALLVEPGDRGMTAEKRSILKI